MVSGRDFLSDHTGECTRDPVKISARKMFLYRAIVDQNYENKWTVLRGPVCGLLSGECGTPKTVKAQF